MKLGLNNNQLKIIAMVAMLLDHIGAYLFPQVRWLRIIGRLAYPIFAFMIAEGCRHTKNRVRYLLQMGGLAAVCQLVDYVARGSLYQCILVTFTLSILTICAIDSGSSAKAAEAVMTMANRRTRAVARDNILFFIHQASFFSFWGSSGRSAGSATWAAPRWEPRWPA